jgi:hypothetical protein
VLLCFGAALILVRYLFAEGVQFFLLRDPIILIPALLAVIGIAGLFALWTTSAATSPIDRLISYLNNGSDAEELLSLRTFAGTDENDMLIAAVHNRFQQSDHGAESRPYFLLVDSHLNVTWTDIDTAARLKHTPAEAVRLNLRELSADAAQVQNLLEKLRGNSDRREITAMSLTLHSTGDRILDLTFRIHTLNSGSYLLIGNETFKQKI